MNIKLNNLKIEPEFEELFSFESHEDKLRHRADMISLRILNEVDKVCEERNINKTELAKAVGTSKSYITQLFTGVKHVNTHMMAKFEDAFNITFDIKAMMPGECQYDLLTKYMDLENISKLRLKNKNWVCYFLPAESQRKEESTSQCVDRMKAEEENNEFKQVG